MKKFLKCYPFALLNPAVKLVEGFAAYSGVLGDKPGDPHKGIDYARRDKSGRFISFDVFSAHDGEVFQGISKKGWGRFVVIYTETGKQMFRTVYAHLRKINNEIPFHPEKDEPRTKGVVISEGRFLGKTGISGWTKRKIQLHFELQVRNQKTKKWEKLDPYGINAKVSSGKYPQSDESLKGLKHYWVSNDPPLADGIE